MQTSNEQLQQVINNLKNLQHEMLVAHIKLQHEKQEINEKLRKWLEG